jgi:hypothetical protein
MVDECDEFSLALPIRITPFNNEQLISPERFPPTAAGLVDGLAKRTAGSLIQPCDSVLQHCARLLSLGGAQSVGSVICCPRSFGRGLNPQWKGLLISIGAGLSGLGRPGSERR